jgi:hypothetical protein
MDRRLGAVRLFVSAATYARLSGLGQRLVLPREEVMDVAVALAERADTQTLRGVAEELRRQRVRAASEAGR